MASIKSIFLIFNLAALSNVLSLPYQVKTLSTGGRQDQQRAFAKEIFQGNMPFGLTTRQPMLQNPNLFNQQQNFQPAQQFNQFGNQRSFENQQFINPTQVDSAGNQQAFLPSQASARFQQNPNQQQNEFQPIQNSQQTTAFTPNQNVFFDSNQQILPVVNQQRFIGQAQSNLIPISEQSQFELPKSFNQQQTAQPKQQFNQRSFENPTQFDSVGNQQAFIPSQVSGQFQQNPNQQQFVSTSMTQQQNEFQPIQNSQQFVFTTQPEVMQQTTVDSNQQIVNQQRFNGQAQSSLKPISEQTQFEMPKVNQKLLNNQNNEVFQLIQTLNHEQISEKLQKMQSNVQQVKPTFTTTKAETTTMPFDSQNQFNSHSQMHFITNNSPKFNNQQQEQETSLNNNDQQILSNQNTQQQAQNVQSSKNRQQQTKKAPINNKNNQQEVQNTLDNQQKTQQFQAINQQQGQEALITNIKQHLAQKIPFNNFKNQEVQNELINNQQTLRNKNMEQTLQVSEVQETTTPQFNLNRQNFVEHPRIQTTNINRFEPFLENQTPRPINVLSTTTRRTITKMVFPTTTVATRSVNRLVNNRINDQQNIPIKLSFNGQTQRPTQPDNRKLQQSLPNQIRNTIADQSTQRADQLQQQPLQQETFCFGRQPEDRIPYPFDQNKFVVCHSETHFDVMTCPQRLVYNLNTLNCETSFKAPSTCASNPCQNGGKCIEMPFFQFSCECPFGFGGERCEKFEVCRPDTCGQNGVCVSLSPGSPVSHYCICANGLSFGLDCGRNTEPNPCLSNDSHDVNFPSKTNPSIYTHCEGHIPHVKFCSFPLVFSFEKQHCDWKDV